MTTQNASKQHVKVTLSGSSKSPNLTTHGAGILTTLYGVIRLTMRPLQRSAQLHKLLRALVIFRSYGCISVRGTQNGSLYLICCILG